LEIEAEDGVKVILYWDRPIDFAVEAHPPNELDR